MMTRPPVSALLLALASWLAGGCASPCEEANGLQGDPAMRTCVFSGELEVDGPTALTPEEGAPVALTVPPYQPGGEPSELPDGTALVESYYGLSWTGTGGDLSAADSASGVEGMAVAPGRDRYALGMRTGGHVLVRAADGAAVAEARVEEGAGAVGGFPNRATHLAFSPDGALLIGGDALRNVVVWDPATGERRWSANIGEGVPAGDGIKTLTASPDGALVAAATGHVVHVWEAATGTPVARWVHPGRPHVEGVVFAPDGAHVAVRQRGRYVAERTVTDSRRIKVTDSRRIQRQQSAIQKAPTVFVWELP